MSTGENPGWTVVQRLRHLGRVTTKSQRWSLGAAVRDRYEELYGQLPEKQLRPKTAGLGGSHCHAVYREVEFIEEMDRIIDRFSLADDSQGRLF